MDEHKNKAHIQEETKAGRFLNSSKTPVAHHILLPLAFIAVGLPVTPEYTVAFALLVWLTATFLRQKRMPLKAQLERESRERRAFSLVAAVGLNPMVKGMFAFMGCVLLAGVLEVYVSPYPQPGRAVFAAHAHLLLKNLILWSVCTYGVMAGFARGWRLKRAALPLAGFLVCHLGYCLWQHYTGIDLVHGIKAVLPDNRFAYGVYRVSGLMGHPITLSYNIMLLVLTLTAVALRLAEDRREKRLWYAVLGLAALNMLITDSRWPIAVCVFVPLILGWRKLWQMRRAVAICAVLGGGAIWLEGSVVGRMHELTDASRPLTERIPRLVYWQVHWKMFKDHPLLGVGYTGYKAAALDYYDRGRYTDIEGKYNAHNIFLQTLADQGLLGLMGLISLFAGVLVAARRLEKIGAKQGLSFLVLGTIASGLMQNNLRVTEYLYGLWLCTALLLAETCALWALNVDGLKSGHVGEQREHGETPKNLQPGAGNADSSPNLPGQPTSIHS